MAPILPAVLKVSSMKSCFVAIPSSWAKHVKFLDEVVVFKILYAEDRTAFVSFKGDISTNSSDADVIQLNSKYAIALGLNDSDELLIQETSEISSPVQKVVVEPLDADDWEIMSLNAEFIETNILNQIRVVWKNQVFPVWAHGSSCLIKVVELIPEDQPGLLAEWTEIQVTPKERVVDLSSQTAQTSSNSSNSVKLFSHFNWHSRLHIPSSQGNETEIEKNDPKDDVSNFPPPIHSQNENEDGSMLSIFRSFVRSVLPQNLEHEEKISSPTEERVKCIFGNFEETISSPFPINFRLRVVPCQSLNDEDAFPLAIEATTVYISSRTLLSQYPQARGVPMCFVARLSKLLSPLEKQEKICQKSSYTPKSSGAKNKSKKEGDESKSAKEKIQTSKESSLFSSVCVRVRILPFFETIPNVPEIICLPLNCVAVSRELQRHLGLEVTSVVRCESIQYGPMTVKNLILHPISNTERSEKEKEKVVAYFKKWATEAFDIQSSLLVSDGTLVSFTSESEKEDFAITLSEVDGFEAVYSKAAAHHNIPSTTNTEAQNEASTLLPLIPQYGYLSKQMLGKVSIKFGTYSSLLSKSIWCSSRLHNVQDLYPSVIAIRIEALGGVKDLYEKAMENFLLWLRLRPLSLIVNEDIPYPNTMLICGTKGVGKSTFAKGLCKKLASPPYFVYAKILDCKPLRGKRVETITRKWEAIFAEAVHRQPSVVLLDDLDELASAPNTPEQEAGPDNIYFSKIAEAFKLFLHQMLVKRHKIAIIATAKSTHSLHLSLANSKERHTFFTVLNISPPGVAEREDILKALVLGKVHLPSTTVEHIPWSDIARKTEGYMAQDLDCLIDKATHAAWLRIEQNDLESDSEEVDLIFEDFEVAFEGYTPSSLRGLQLHHGGTKTWKDVGGLNHVKRVIQQLLIWPMEYPKLFAQCPLKPQSSILLYGAPGTGKTLLGSVIAKECGLNFISIQGPELLSKYIGASEQAVRDLFQRGMSAKPCILFFDEFDAIAPKRGHDSTGVTDRVVNQLLTQMDGVESAKGVYIIAATSRPDLIDPALLRPGRLDKCVHCPLPDEDEREAILKALSSSLSLADDVDFATVAKTAENFSGADLQALLYSSQLEAFHDGQKQQKERRQSLGSTSEESSSSLDFIYIPTLAEGPKIPTVEEEKKIVQEINAIRENIMRKHARFFSKRPSRKFSTVCIVIQQKHLLKTLSQMKPSVSASERKRYQAIYDKFVNSSGGDFTPPVTGVKRVTLA